MYRFALACCALAASAAVTDAQQPPAGSPVSSGFFIVRLGTDTVAVESFSRYADRVEGVLVRRSPATSEHRYTVRLNANGQPTHFEDQMRPVNGTLVAGMGPRRVVIDFTADSAFSETQADTVVRRRMAAPMAFPAIPESYALYELWLSTMRARGTDSAMVNLVGGGAVSRTPARVFPTDTARVWYFGSPMSIRLDNSGRLLIVDARATTVKYIVARLAQADIAAMTRSFAARDAAGQPLAAGSGRDTARATVGAATIWVDYGRPSVRGRNVFSAGVLGDTLWRAGANAATQLDVNKEIEIGGHALPAGRYSLWIRVPANNAKYELVVNSQSGQWGTSHDATKDLFSVPLTVRPLTTPVEVFTTRIVTSGASATLVFTWDRTELSAAVRPR
jgi:hypothetical protein